MFEQIPRRFIEHLNIEAEMHHQHLNVFNNLVTSLSFFTHTQLNEHFYENEQPTQASLRNSDHNRHITNMFELHMCKFTFVFD